MEKFVRITAPTGKIDFMIKLFVLLLIGGGFNHLRDVLTYGFAGRNTFFGNFSDAAFTALPMCTFALLLIGHLNSLQKRLYAQATQDLLTGLPNRRWFMDNTPDHIGPDQALFIIDVDHFKRINDTFGHDSGDRCLQQMGGHLRATLGTADCYARIGGEEFAIFLPRTDDQKVQKIAEQISSGFLFEADEAATRQITASVGIAFDENGQSRAQALRLADQAAYQAKGQGRACYVVISDTPDCGRSLANIAMG